MAQLLTGHVLLRIICRVLCGAGLLVFFACVSEPPRVVSPTALPPVVIKKTVPDQTPLVAKPPVPPLGKPLKSNEPIRKDIAVPKADKVIAKEDKIIRPIIEPLHHFTIIGVPATSISGKPWDTPAHDIRVTAYDQSGKVKTDYVGSVYFTSTDRSASLPFTAASKYRFTAKDKGTHTFSSKRFVISSVGTQSVTVTDGRIQGAAGYIDVFHSGSDWVKVSESSGFPPRSKHGCVTFKNKIWVIGGEMSWLKNDVWFSSDGVSWSCATDNAPFSRRSDHLVLVFDNKIWVIGGKDGSHFMGTNDVWYTTNGVDWTCAAENASFSKRFSHSGVVFDNRMWVIGGKFKNDIWSSTNGYDWTQASSDVPFVSRYGHVSLVYKSRIWVIGGYNSAGYNNDVWSSVNGSDWSQVVKHAGFSPRAYHKGLVYGGKMWVIGGYENVSKNDVWYSSDGANWSLASEHASFGERSRHDCTVFNSRMWLLDGNSLGDVWRTGSNLNK
jgi:dihydrofolate reductase